MSPGFFGFYAHIGALVALEAAGLLEKVGWCVDTFVLGTDVSMFFLFVFCRRVRCNTPPTLTCCTLVCLWASFGSILSLGPDGGLIARLLRFSHGGRPMLKYFISLTSAPSPTPARLRGCFLFEAEMEILSWGRVCPALYEPHTLVLMYSLVSIATLEARALCRCAPLPRRRRSVLVGTHNPRKAPRPNRTAGTSKAFSRRDVFTEQPTICACCPGSGDGLDSDVRRLSYRDTLIVRRSAYKSTSC